MWITSSVQIFHWNGTTWSTVAIPNQDGDGSQEAGLAVPAPGDVWVGGGPAGSQLTDAGWINYDPGDDRTVNVLWAYSPNDIWGSQSGEGSPGYLSHFDGTNDVSVGPFMAIDAFWESGDGGVWGVGVDTTSNNPGPSPQGVFHWDGIAYDGGLGPELVNLAQQASSTGLLNGLWGSSNTDLWAVGDGATAIHFDGTAWSSPVTLPGAVTGALSAIWGDGVDDYWSVGQGGVLLHFDGADWSLAASPTSSDLVSVWGSGPEDVWAVGPGAVLHFSP